MMAPRLTHRGFTLIELVVSIAVSGIVVVFASLFIKTPIDAYLSQSRHAELLDSLGAAWPQIERDIHTALPTSVRASRNGSVVALEMMTAVASAHYLSDPRTASFNAAGVINPPPGQYYLSINNTTPYNSFATQMTPANRTLTFIPNVATNEVTIGVSPLFNFASLSPVSHAYLVYSHPITYLCNETTGTIQRYSEYTLAPAQTSRDTDAKLMAAGAVRTVVAGNMTSCNFQALAETATQGQVVAMRITATRNGEPVSALFQAAVEKLQ